MMDKQSVLIRALYRKLLRESQRIPPNSSLLHLDQTIGNTQVKDSQTLHHGIRLAFRIQNKSKEDGIQQAIESLRALYALDYTSLPSKVCQASSNDDTNDACSQKYSTISNAEEWLDAVEWLQPISEMLKDPKHTHSDKDDTYSRSEYSELPVFALSGPLFPEPGQLPVVSQFSDVPVSGMEIPLKIFEPRYRQMYNDLLSNHRTSSAPFLRKCFIVPFCHPYRSGQFASFGWLYEIMQVQDIADETNGRYHLVCNHLVTKPVKIHHIVNPQDFEIQSTYIRAIAEIREESFGLDDDDDDDDDSLPQKSSPRQSNDLQPLEDLLRNIQQQSTSSVDKSVVDRLLMALAEGSIWPVAQIWVWNLQMQILELQVRIANKIQQQSSQALRQEHSTSESQISNTRNSNKRIAEEMILLAQEPHKEDLQSMLIEVSTLIPLLLQDVTQAKQCERLCQRIYERMGSKVEGTKTRS